MFFAVVNLLKLPPYFMQGQLSPPNVTTSAMLFPVAWISTLVGIWLVRRVPAQAVLPLLYACQFVISLKLLWDGVSEVMRGG